jgi:hypothetical protein
MPSIVGILLCTCLAFALSGCGDDEQSAGSEKTAAPAAAESTHGTTYDASTEPRDATIKIALTSTGMVPQFVTARVGPLRGVCLPQRPLAYRGPLHVDSRRGLARQRRAPRLGAGEDRDPAEGRHPHHPRPLAQRAWSKHGRRG